MSNEQIITHKSGKHEFLPMMTISGHNATISASASLVLETMLAINSRSNCVLYSDYEAPLEQDGTVKTVKFYPRPQVERSIYTFHFMLPDEAEVMNISTIGYNVNKVSDNSYISLVDTRSDEISDFRQMPKNKENKIFFVDVDNNKNTEKIESDMMEKAYKDKQSIVSKNWNVWGFRLNSSDGKFIMAEGQNQRIFFPFRVFWKLNNKEYMSFISFFTDSSGENNQATPFDIAVRNYIMNLLNENYFGQKKVKQYKFNEDYLTGKTGEPFESVGETEPKNIDFPHVVKELCFPLYNMKKDVKKSDNFSNDHESISGKSTSSKFNSDINDKISSYFEDTEMLNKYIEDFEEQCVTRRDAPIILPTVSIGKSGSNSVVCCFYPEQNKGTEVLLKHIKSLTNMFTSDMKKKFIVKNFNDLDTQEEYNLKYNDEILGKFSMHETISRLITNFYIKHRGLMRLIAGTDSATKVKEAFYNQQFFNTNPNVKNSSPGFGCLFKPSIKFVNLCVIEDYSSLTIDNKKIHKFLWDDKYRNDDISDLLGMTSDELDSLIFIDAIKFRSLYCTNLSYVELLNLYIADFRTSNISAIPKEKYYKIMDESYDKRIKDLFELYSLSEARVPPLKESNTDNGDNQKSRNLFIRILQNPYSFRAARKLPPKETPTQKSIDNVSIDDASKIIYNVNSLETLSLKIEISSVYKKIPRSKNTFDNQEKKLVTKSSYCEAGLTFAYKSIQHIPQQKSIFDHETTSSFKGQNFENRDFLSPYGYTAKAFYENSNILNGSLEFFLATDIDNNVRTHYYKREMMRNGSEYASEVKMTKILTPQDIIVEPFNISTNKDEITKNGFIMKPIKYYANSKDRKMKLVNIKQDWIEYSKTKNFFKKLSSGDIKFAVDFMRFLEIKFHNSKSTSIFNIIPNSIIREDILLEFLNIEIKRGFLMKVDNTYFEGRKLIYDPKKKGTGDFKRYIYEKMDVSRKYPTIYKNFITNCDVKYVDYRILLMLLFIRSEMKNTTYTPTSIINGYLISKDFTKSSNRDLPPVERIDYLSISASVYYEKNPMHEMRYTDFFDKGYIQEKAKEIEARFENHSPYIYANIANVPMYYSSGIDNVEQRVKTMNTGFSVFTHSLHWLTSGIRSSKPEYIHTFSSIDGAPYNEAGIATFDIAEKEALMQVEKEAAKIWEGNFTQYVRGESKSFADAAIANAMAKPKSVSMNENNKKLNKNIGQNYFRPKPFFTRFAAKLLQVSEATIRERDAKKGQKEIARIEKEKGKKTEEMKKLLEKNKLLIEGKREIDYNEHKLNVLQRSDVIASVSFSDRSELSALQPMDENYRGETPLGLRQNILKLTSIIYSGIADEKARRSKDGVLVTTRRDMSSKKVEEFLQNQRTIEMQQRSRY